MNTMSWQIEEWFEEDRRHLLIKAEMRVMPYVRQTRNGRWGMSSDAARRAREYNRNQAEIRDALYLIMKMQGIRPFADVKIGFGAWIWLNPKLVMRKKRRATIDNPNKSDLGNLEKALEDAFQGVLFGNDVWIWDRDKGGKRIDDHDHFQAHIWETESLVLPEPRKQRRKRRSPTNHTTEQATLQLQQV